ncbi:uncharacterized protein [Equus caballus]|uniref:uncharacterized protein isoform X1 n=1 Tax=Equus caballus TaxID=9796 RepID=UPI0038B28E9E
MKPWATEAEHVNPTARPRGQPPYGMHPEVEVLDHMEFYRFRSLIHFEAKPIYAGWLLLAPDGTHLDNPVHRSRKWQWRFFILYKHGLLRYALDEMVWKDSPSDFWERGLLEISREGMMSPSTLTRASVRTTGESLFALQSWIISGKRKKDRQFSHLKVVNQNTSAG